MKKRNYLFVFVMLWLNVISVSSQETGKAEGPDFIMQYGEATYKWLHKNSDGFGASLEVTGPYLQGVAYDDKDLGNGYTEKSRTFVVYESAPDLDALQTFVLKKTIVIIKNPLKIELPSHLCPSGTQLVTTSISSYFQKTFTVTGSSTASITNEGLLTYNSGSNDYVTVKMYVSFNGKVVGSVEKSFYLNPHIVGVCSFMATNGVFEQNPLSFIGNNSIPAGKEISIEFSSPIQNLSWTTYPTNIAVNISYNSTSRILKFTANNRPNSTFRFTFSYRSVGCPNNQTTVCNFKILSSYNVSYVSSSNIIRIEDDSEDLSVMMTRASDRYVIANATTGTIKKEGLLSSEVSEIDVSTLPQGIYVVQIISGTEVSSYKVVVKR